MIFDEDCPRWRAVLLVVSDFLAYMLDPLNKCDAQARKRTFDSFDKKNLLRIYFGGLAFFSEQINEMHEKRGEL